MVTRISLQNPPFLSVLIISRIIINATVSIGIRCNTAHQHLNLDSEMLLAAVEDNERDTRAFVTLQTRVVP
jgi:hypothetical protein